MKWHLASALLTLTALGASIAPSAAHGASKQVVTVGTEGVYAPFTFLDEKGELTGYDVEVVKEIAKRVDLEVKFLPTPWDSMFLGLDSKKFDLIANQIAKNTEREKKYLFSDSYLISGVQIIVRGDRPGTFSNGLSDLKGLKVGTSVGSNYSKLLEEFNAKNGKSFDVKYYDGNVSVVLQDISNGRLDATLNDRLTVGFNVKKLGLNAKPVGAPIALEPSHLVVRKDKESEALLQKINQGLAAVKKDGTLAKLSEKWFGADYTK